MEEIASLTDSFLNVKYVHPGTDREISYENVCFKVLDGKEGVKDASC
jgi:hypothetical protein